MRYAVSIRAALIAGGALLSVAPAALAQNAPVEVRVDRLEKEMRAVQRKVFPGGTPVEPVITAPPRPTTAPGAPSASVLSDMTQRVAALEGQLATLTGQVEQNSYKIKQLEDAFAKYKADTEGRLLAADPPPVRPTVPAPAPTASGGTPKPAPKPATETAASGSGNEVRKAAVAAIERPSTGDDGMDAYNYGFRLWDAKFYPEAQAQLKATVDKYGTTSVGSRANNLLGRAYLDDGKPALASVAFYENYQKRPRGDRAADSLTYLGEALIQLKKPADACKVYSELNEVYGATLSATLKGLADKGKARAKCS